MSKLRAQKNEKVLKILTINPPEKKEDKLDSGEEINELYLKKLKELIIPMTPEELEERDRLYNGDLGKKRFRNWCFTEFDNFDELYYKLVEQQMNGSVIYTVFQLEKCPETGRKHMQGYITLKNPCGMNWVKKVLTATAHLIVANGTALENQKYCTKELSRVKGPWEFGIMPVGQGKRTDLEDLKKLIDESGITDPALMWELDFKNMLKYKKSIEAYILSKSKMRTEPIYVVALIGKSGSGKTKYVYDKHKYEDVYVKDTTNKWWDGYNGQPVVLLDDFKGGMDVTTMKQLLDRYPMNIEIKGGNTKISNATRWVYITSNHNPEFWWNDGSVNEKDMEAVERRIDETIEFTHILTNGRKINRKFRINDKGEKEEIITAVAE